MKRRLALGCPFLATTSFTALAAAAPAWSQTAPPPPTRYVLDGNGVNLATGQFVLPVQDASIGGKANGLSQIVDRGNDATSSDGFSMTIHQSGSTWSALWFDGTTYRTETFTQSGSTYVSQSGDGSALSQSSGIMTLTLSDRRQIIYGNLVLVSGDSPVTFKGRASQIVNPDGSSVSIGWSAQTYCTINNLNCPTQDQQTAIRLQGVSNSYGYNIHYAYQTNVLKFQSSYSAWMTLTKATLSNMAIDNCQATSPSCSYSQTWPSATYSSSQNGSVTTETVTDTLGRATKYTTGGAAALSVQRPGSSTTNLAFNVDTNYRVTSVTRDGITWGYSFSLAGSTMTATVTNPDGSHRTVISDTNVGLPTKVTDELNRQTTYVYDGYGRLTKTTLPEGNYVTLNYDSNGNVSSSIATGKDGVSTISTSAYYPCASSATCAEPQWTKDGNGNQTDYTYDNATGVVTSVTQPAPTAGATRPQTRYSYSSLQAYYNVSGGGIVASGQPMTLLTGISQCRTSSSCSGTADETATTISYGSQASGTGNNLLPVSKTIAAGDGSVSATRAFAYDAVGNLTSVDGPLPGTADTTSFIYDADRELTETVSPDPDGSGSLKNRAQQITYSADGVATNVAIGTANADGSNFVMLQQVATTLDAADRPIMKVLSDGTTTYAVSQRQYDGSGRVACEVTRMNPASWTTLMSSCSPDPSGPDRVIAYTYDSANEVTQVTSAYGTSFAANTATLTYSGNGKVATATDANNNVTAYAYDTFDRPWRNCYQTSTQAACAGSPADYDQASATDSDGNVTIRRLRDGQSIGYTYDALNRLTAKDRPNSVYWENDLAYAYDNLGELTQAWDGSGHTLGFAYDALGRLTSQSDTWYATGNASFQYDAAGRRTRQTWWDGQYVTFSYDTVGEMTGITENGGPVPISFSYDDLGRRTSLNRANGASTTYGYDGASRLTGLTLYGGSSNSYTFGYNAAGQITSRTNSNDAYAWTGAANVDRSYGVNGLNQLTSSGGTSLGYDGRGNLTASGSSSYTYTSENQLATFPSGQGLAYDALGRLFNVSSDQGLNVTLSYAGSQVLAEINQATGAVLRRYVYGPGTDEPLLWYEGSDLSNRRYLSADERGSVVAVTDNSGNAIAINSYDEFGIPGTNNQGRFQYTGQKWFAALGMYDYKARTYSPTLGRFMQTDPIGYGDGMNWYNYVGGDPMNFVDPSGKLHQECDAYNAHYSFTNSDGDTELGVADAYYVCKTVLDPGDLGPGNAGGPLPGGKGGTGTNAPAAIPQEPPQNTQTPRCGNGTAAKIADIADKISLYSGELAVGAGIAGLAAAPTGAGLVALESVAAVSGVVSLAASGVGAVAHLANRDYLGALFDAGGIAGGVAVGKLAGSALASTRAFGNLSASQAREVQLASNGAGTAVGAASSLYSCR